MSKHPRDIELRAGSAAALFERLADPNEDGCSREVHLSEFTGKYAALKDGFGNGATWARSDGSLGKKYIIERHKHKGKIVSIELLGYKRAPAAQRGIPVQIRKKLRDTPCVVTGTTSSIEIDHKHGRYEGSVSEQLSDYQPMHKSVNNTKREHCRACQSDGMRFDARQLGYSVGWTKGKAEYRSCHGCYWHDPQEFNRVVSHAFSKMEM